MKSMYVGFVSILSLHVCLRIITLPYSPPLGVSLSPPLSISLSLSSLSLFLSLSLSLSLSLLIQGSLICRRTDGALHPHENSDSVCMEISRCWRYGEEEFGVHRHTFYQIFWATEGTEASPAIKRNHVLITVTVTAISVLGICLPAVMHCIITITQ